jgi:hypothetical protein
MSSRFPIVVLASEQGTNKRTTRWLLSRSILGPGGMILRQGPILASADVTAITAEGESITTTAKINTSN